MAEGPCGSFDATDRSKGVTKWSVGGSNIAVLSTHGRVTWEFNVALASDPTKFLPLVQEFGQSGAGYICFKGVPGFASWVGQPVVLQVVQHGHDGLLYQCAAIEFVPGGPDPAQDSCTNSNGVVIDPMVPGPGPQAPAQPTASSPSSASATTGTGSTPTLSKPQGASPTSAGQSHHEDGEGDEGDHHHEASSSTTPTASTKTATAAAVGEIGSTSGATRPVTTAAASTLEAFQNVMGALALLAAALIAV